jgi:phosphinothricin acetyltransferase
MTATIRLATPHDAPDVQAIYAPVVRASAISCELELPTVGDMERRISEVVERMPWLVCEHRGKMLSYAYAGPHRGRAAQQLAVDISVHQDPEASAHEKWAGAGYLPTWEGVPTSYETLRTFVDCTRMLV